MNLLHKTSAISFHLLHTGYQSFKDRIKQELSTVSRTTLDSVMDDASLYILYRSGESAEFVAASIAGPNIEFDDEYADAG